MHFVSNKDIFYKLANLGFRLQFHGELRFLAL